MKQVKKLNDRNKKLEQQSKNLIDFYIRVKVIMQNPVKEPRTKVEEVRKTVLKYMEKENGKI